MSINSLTSLAATSLCLVTLTMNDARASREFDEPVKEDVGPRAVTLSCDDGLTHDQSRACEDAVLRWRLCQTVYVTQRAAASDDAFYACFEGAK
jgi:hypothetical protein